MANGIADPVTWAKIESVINSPYQVGKSHPDVPKFKEMLEVLNYGTFDRSTCMMR